MTGEPGRDNGRAGIIGFVKLIHAILPWAVRILWFVDTIKMDLGGRVILDAGGKHKGKGYPERMGDG